MTDLQIGEGAFIDAKDPTGNRCALPVTIVKLMPANAHGVDAMVRIANVVRIEDNDQVDLPVFQIVPSPNYPMLYTARTRELRKWPNDIFEGARVYNPG